MVESINSYLSSNPSMMVVLMAVTSILLWLFIENFVISAAKRAGQIQANLDHQKLLEEFELSISKSKAFGELEAKFEKLPDIEQFEKTISTTLKNIEFEFWQKQQVDQVRREKIELLMTEVQSHSKFSTRAFVEVYQGRMPIELHSNQKIAMLIRLYFKELLASYQIYNSCFMEFQAEYNKIIHGLFVMRTNPTQPELEALKEKSEKFQRHSAEFTIDIADAAKGLTCMTDFYYQESHKADDN